MPRRELRQVEPPGDLFSYLEDRPNTPHLAISVEPSITVTDNWPIMVPVTDHEVRIIEAFFADVLDELFGTIP